MRGWMLPVMLLISVATQADTRTFGSDDRFQCRKMNPQFDSEITQCSRCDRITSGRHYGYGFVLQHSTQSTPFVYRSHSARECWEERYKHDSCDEALLADEYGNLLVCTLDGEGKPKHSCSVCLQTGITAYPYKVEFLKYGKKIETELYRSSSACDTRRIEACLK